MFSGQPSDPLERAHRFVWISRILSLLVAIGYSALGVSVAGTAAFVALVPYLGIALLCTWFPASMGQGRKAYTRESGAHYMGMRWGWTPWRLVLGGGWLLLLLPGIIGVVFWLK